MIDHLGFGVSDFEQAKAFYAAALAPLGATLIMEFSAAQSHGGAASAGFGRDGKPEFWIGAEGRTTPPTHIAITARTRGEVDAFYAAAIAAGGRDNGGPGLRPQYHPNYYAAFVIDPDGHNFEAVCHTLGDAADQTYPA